MADTTVTITEALQEVKTILARIEKKQDFVMQNLVRKAELKDPLEKDGGQEKAVTQELQAIGDLQNRLVAIRRAIRLANESTLITVNGKERSIADWLVWKREVAPLITSFDNKMSVRIAAVRSNTRQDDWRSMSSNPTQPKESDIVVNIPEKAFASDIEALQETLGALDGLLSQIGRAHV
jgi:hypothetical protein